MNWSDDRKHHSIKKQKKRKKKKTTKKQNIIIKEELTNYEVLQQKYCHEMVNSKTILGKRGLNQVLWLLIILWFQLCIQQTSVDQTQT